MHAEIPFSPAATPPPRQAEIHLQLLEPPRANYMEEVGLAAGSAHSMFTASQMTEAARLGPSPVLVCPFLFGRRLRFCSPCDDGKL